MLCLFKLLLFSLLINLIKKILKQGYINLIDYNLVFYKNS